MSPDETVHRERALESLDAELEAFRAERLANPPQAALREVVDTGVGEHVEARAKMGFASAAVDPERHASDAVLTARQTELLRRLVQSDHPLPVEKVDARILRGLLRKGLARTEGAGVQPTKKGEEFYRTHVRKRRRGGERIAAADRTRDHVESILRAVGDLEQVLPRTKILQVGDIEVEAADVLEGLRTYAEQVRQPSEKKRGGSDHTQ